MGPQAVYSTIIMAKLRSLTKNRMASNSGKRHRPKPVRPQNGCALGVDIGGTLTKLAVVAPDGSVKSLDSIPTRGNADSFLENTFKTATRLCRKADIEVTAIGIAVAATLDTTRSAALYSPNIHWLQGVPLYRAFKERFHLPTVLEIDSNAAALAEYHYGAGVGSRPESGPRPPKAGRRGPPRRGRPD